MLGLFRSKTKKESEPVLPKDLGHRPVRRQRSGKGWLISDEGRLDFVSSINAGVMTGVEFVHVAPSMACVADYDSTGEAVGHLTECSPVMPGDAVRRIEIIYDRKLRRFHEKGDSSKIVDRADYLVLFPKGTSFAGWKS